MDMRHAARIQRDIVRLCHAGLDSTTLRVETLRHLRKLIPIDSFWFATADPATLLFTGSVVEGIPEHLTSRFIDNEFLQDDVNKWARLARAARPANGLYAATEGHPYESARYREILAPLHFGDELRVAVIDGSSCWGFMCLHREQSSPSFTPEEMTFVSRLTPHLAAGLRTALLIDNMALPTESDGPGLLMLADDLSVNAMTPNAERWLEEIADWPQRDELPQAIYGIAAQVRMLQRDGAAQPAQMPRARVRTRSGQWLILHASRLSAPSAAGQTAVILEVARPTEVAPLVLHAYNLTEREAHVSQLVLKGLSTVEIAAALSVSALTVQQHLKAVFDKIGVRSRRELAARIFAQQYLPRILSGSRIGADGWFVPPKI
jgi:DNA-binding CsgD family transcriptional regulator